MPNADAKGATCSLSRLRQPTRLTVIVLTVAAFLRFSPAITQPLRRDEAASARLYASFHYDRTMAATGREGPFNLDRFAKGVGKALRQKWDPNNHLVNSLAVSSSCFVFGFSEWAMRLPAALASLGAIFLLIHLGWRWTKNPWLAAGLGALLAVNPYSIHYGQTARGYAFMLALLLAQICLIDRARRQGLNRRLNIALIAIGAALFLNTASLAFAWLAPVYLAFLWQAILAPAEGSARNRPPSESKPSPDRALLSGPISQWRRFWQSKPNRGWIWQAIAISGACAAFALFHFSEFRHAQGRYGTPFESFPELVDVLWHAGWVVFPGWWMAIAILGLGCTIRLASRCAERRWLWFAIGLSLVSLLGYTIMSGAAPYGRTVGFLLPLSLLALAGIWRSATTSTRQALSLGVACAVVAGTVQAAVRWREERVGYNVAAQRISQRIAAGSSTGAAFFAPLPSVYGEEMKMYLPEDPDDVRLDPEEEAMSLLIAAETYGKDAGFTFPCDLINRAQSTGWPLPREWERWLIFSPPGAAWRVGLFEIPVHVDNVPPAGDSDKSWLGIVCLADTKAELAALLEELRSAGGDFESQPFIPIQAVDQRIGLLFPMTSTPASRQIARRLYEAKPTTAISILTLAAAGNR